MALAAALLLLLTTGLLLDRAWLRPPQGGGGGEVIGRALLLGLACAGLLGLALDGAGLGLRPFPALLAWTLVGGASLLRLRRRPPPPQTTVPEVPGEPPGHAGRLLAGLLLAGTALSLFLLVRSGWIRPPYQFDALTRWMFKTRVLALEGTLDGPVSTDPHFWFTHQRYPPLVSCVAALPALLTGRFDERLASALFPWFAVAAVLLAHGFLRRRTGRLPAATGAFWLATLPLMAWLDQDPPGAGAFSAMADVPLAAFLLGATLAAMDAAAGRRPALLEAGLLLGCAALTKNEGLPLLLLLPLGLLLDARPRRLPAALAAGLLGLGLWLLLWGLRSRAFPALDENYPARLHLDALQAGLARLPGILAAFLGEATRWRNWHLTWLAVPALLLLGSRTALRPSLRLGLLVLAGQLGACVVALTVTAWHSPAVPEGQDPVATLMHLTLGRLLLQVAPLAIVLALAAAWGPQASPSRRPPEAAGCPA